jgi:hypothetical protein
MVRGTTSSGMKKCRKFTVLVNSVHPISVVLAALAGLYCTLDHHRNGHIAFLDRLPLIQ